MTFYRQCILRRGTTRTTSWIPEKFARQGKYIKLKETDGWKDGWLVMEVGARMSEDQVRERSQDYKHQRKASDR